MTVRTISSSPKLALIAGLVSALLIGGVLAAATDLFIFGGNNAETNDLGIDPNAREADVQIALTQLDDQPCEFLETYSDGPLVGVFDVSIDLQAIAPLPDGRHVATVNDQRICILNAGTETARLSVEAATASAGDNDLLCSAGETGAGDTSCGSGDGELDKILFLNVLTGADFDGIAPCPDGEAVGAGYMPMGTVVDTGIDIPVGEACPFLVEVVIDDFGNEQDWLQAQTDQLRFNLFVRLETP